MPMIIKNGKRYCSTGGEAENVVYNNTESGLEATNMQDAIDELNSNLYKLDFDNIVDLTNVLHALNANYTIPKNGILKYTLNTCGSSTKSTYISSNKFGNKNVICAHNNWKTGDIHVFKDEVLTTTYFGDNGYITDSSFIYFIPYI